jgi:ribosomal protein S18 acetylase RimI-like enzyme
MNLKIALRPASDADEPFLFELFRALRAGRFDFQPGGHPQMAVTVRLQFKAQEHALASHCAGSEHYIILLDGAPVGRLRVARDETGIELADISVLPDHQRKGIGSAVMKNLIAEAHQGGLSIRSMVAQANEASFHFYRNLGFEVTGQDAGYVRLRWRPS